MVYVTLYRSSHMCYVSVEGCTCEKITKSPLPGAGVRLCDGLPLCLYAGHFCQLGSCTQTQRTLTGVKCPYFQAPRTQSRDRISQRFRISGQARKHLIVERFVFLSNLTVTDHGQEQELISTSPSYIVAMHQRSALLYMYAKK